MATYHGKLEDSLITKIQLFLFEKSLSEDFEINKYYTENNINKIIEDFTNFKITNELANTYSTKYFQFTEDDNIVYLDKRKKMKDIFSSLIFNTKYMLSKSNIKNFKEIFEQLKKEYEKEFNQQFPKSKYDSLLSHNNCSYCGISIEQIEVLGKNGLLNNKRSDTRGYTLEIDRKLPNLEYFSENCCMSCYWCNNAKTDEFSPLEFKLIAKSINQVWNDRLKKIKLDTVEFNENSDLWKINYDTQLLK